jgi:very-short-patch-repair endonuclease
MGEGPSPSSASRSRGKLRYPRPQGGRSDVALHPSPLAGEGGARAAGVGGRGGDTLLDRAKHMRAKPTEAERRLWSILRNKRLSSYKFKRQQVIGPYIVDFVNFERRLIVEADGSQHVESAYDLKRDAWLKAQGFQVLRLWNHHILGETEVAADAVWHALQAPLPPFPNPSPARAERL